MFRILGVALLTLFFVVVSNAGILPTSRGGTGANLTPSNGKVVTSSASALQLSSSIVLPAGGTLVLPAGSASVGGAPLTITAGSTLTTREKGAFESNGTDLYWTDSTGARYKLNKTLSN